MMMMMMKKVGGGGGGGGGALYSLAVSSFCRAPVVLAARHGRPQHQSTQNKQGERIDGDDDDEAATEPTAERTGPRLLVVVVGGGGVDVVVAGAAVALAELSFPLASLPVLPVVRRKQHTPPAFASNVQLLRPGR